jgi:ankyrin repeat protein
MKRMFIVVCTLLSLVGMTSCADIHKSVRSGDVADVEMALSGGEDVNKKDKDGNTPLMLAARHGDLGVVQTLVKKGADLKAKNKDGCDALCALSNYSMSGSPAAGKVGQPSEQVGITTDGHLKTAEYVVNEGADVNAKTNDGSTALMLAARLNKKDLVELLLSRGADVNAVDQQGNTALINAVIKGQGEVVCPLIRNGADVNAKDREGRTALQFAEQYGHKRIAQLLRNGCPKDGGLAAREVSDSSLNPAGRKIVDVLVAEKLIESLRDPEPSVRWESARRLGEMKDSRSVGPLIGALTDEHPYTRRRAAASLGNTQDFRAVEPLMKAMRDEDAFVQKYALESLMKITGQRFGTDIKQWQEWWNRRIRQN